MASALMDVFFYPVIHFSIHSMQSDYYLRCKVSINSTTVPILTTIESTVFAQPRDGIRDFYLLFLRNIPISLNTVYYQTPSAPHL